MIEEQLRELMARLKARDLPKDSDSPELAHETWGVTIDITATGRWKSVWHDVASGRSAPAADRQLYQDLDALGLVLNPWDLSARNIVVDWGPLGRSRPGEDGWLVFVSVAGGGQRCAHIGSDAVMFSIFRTLASRWAVFCDAKGGGVLDYDGYQETGDTDPKGVSPGKARVDPWPRPVPDLVPWEG